MQDIAAFVVASLIIELTPGPNMAFLTVVSATHGRRFGFATVAGVTLGLAIIGTLAAFGIAGLSERASPSYQFIRWAGIAYLLWLAWSEWRAAGDTAGVSGTRQGGGLAYFRHGLVVNVLNPKAAAFYVAVLPGFVEPGTDVLASTLRLTTVYVGVATGVHVVVVWLGGALHAWLSHGTRLARVRRGLAGMLVVVAAWMVFRT